MARGLPDYYRGVDIAYQALARLLVRPTYGPGKRGADTVTVTANAETELLSVTGQGMIYGGHISASWTASQKYAQPYLYIDGELVAGLSFEQLYVRGIYRVPGAGLQLLRYLHSKYRYVVGITPGLTFETSFALAYNEREGETPDVIFEIIYALIT